VTQQVTRATFWWRNGAFNTRRQHYHCAVGEGSTCMGHRGKNIFVLQAAFAFYCIGLSTPFYFLSTFMRGQLEKSGIYFNVMGHGASIRTWRKVNRETLLSCLLWQQVGRSQRSGFSSSSTFSVWSLWSEKHEIIAFIGRFHVAHCSRFCEVGKLNQGRFLNVRLVIALWLQWVDNWNLDFR